MIDLIRNDWANKAEKEQSKVRNVIPIRTMVGHQKDAALKRTLLNTGILKISLSSKVKTSHRPARKFDEPADQRMVILALFIFSHFILSSR